jgi:hypothetical protein
MAPRQYDNYFRYWYSLEPRIAVAGFGGLMVFVIGCLASSVSAIVIGALVCLTAGAWIIHGWVRMSQPARPIEVRWQSWLEEAQPYLLFAGTIAYLLIAQHVPMWVGLAMAVILTIAIYRYLRKATRG